MVGMREEGKLERGGRATFPPVVRGNRGHGARRCREDGGKNLAGADPDGLAAVDIVHFPRCGSANLRPANRRSRACLFQGAFIASMIHIHYAAISRAATHYVEAVSRFLPITFVNRKDGIAVTTNAIMTRLNGWVR